MSHLPAELKYTKTHEWIRIEPDGMLVIGITDHAQETLGDLVFVEIPEVGRVVAAGDSCAVVESVKAASDIYSPVAGEVTGGNDSLADTPEAVNSDPYGQGWILKIRPDEANAIDGLLDADEYQAVVDEESA